MTISEALKKLHKTITGKDATGDTIEEVVSELNDNYPEGGGTVTIDANPTEGSTNAVSSGGVFNALGGKADVDEHITFSEIGAIPGAEFVSKTPAEVKALADAGKTVAAHGDGGYTGIELVLSFHGSTGDDKPIVMFSATGLSIDGTNTPTVYELFGFDDGWTMLAYTIPDAPLIVHATENSGTISITDTITVAQIKSAAASNRAVCIDVADGASTVRYMYAGNTGTDPDVVMFSYSVGLSNTVHVHTLSFSDPASVTKTEVQLTGTNP